MTGFSLVGPIQTRVGDFLRIKHAIRLEQKGMKFSQGSALTAATSKGYVPRSLVGRGNIVKRREVALAYMEYVTTLLTTGGFARQYGEEIVMGFVTYDDSVSSDCGCPVMLGSDRSNIISSIENATMCIGHEERS